MNLVSLFLSRMCVIKRPVEGHGGEPSKGNAGEIGASVVEGALLGTLVSMLALPTLVGPESVASSAMLQFCKASLVMVKTDDRWQYTSTPFLVAKGHWNVDRAECFSEPQDEDGWNPDFLM
ncbi:hypothetical protein MRY87_12990 [bacterium]|nr:hypothetical protein [bacterium]